MKDGATMTTVIQIKDVCFNITMTKKPRYHSTLTMHSYLSELEHSLFQIFMYLYQYNYQLIQKNRIWVNIVNLSRLFTTFI